MKEKFGKPSGFTLLEVMIALAILALVGVAFLRAQASSVQLIDESGQISLATLLAREKMAELESLGFPEAGKTSGPGGEASPGFAGNRSSPQRNYRSCGMGSSASCGRTGRENATWSSWPTLFKNRNEPQRTQRRELSDSDERAALSLPPPRGGLGGGMFFESKMKITPRTYLSFHPFSAPLRFKESGSGFTLFEVLITLSIMG